MTVEKFSYLEGEAKVHWDEASLRIPNLNMQSQHFTELFQKFGADAVLVEKTKQTSFGFIKIKYNMLANSSVSEGHIIWR